MKNIVLSKQSSNEDLKRYFAEVLEVSKSGDEFPIDLDEVWPLVYPRKDHAVRELTEKFIQNVDYQLLPKNEEQDSTKQRGGSNKATYMLTVSCMEFLVARKVRAVFEVYRQVFHKMTDTLRIPKTYQEALRALADKIDETEAQKKLIAEQQPKADYFDALVDRNLLTNLRTTAKQIGVPQNQLIECLLRDKYLYRDKQGQLLPYAQYSDLFQVKDWQNSKKAGRQTLVTPRGKETFKLLYGTKTLNLWGESA